MGDLVLVEGLRLALALVGADEILQRALQASDGGLGAADFFFQFVNAIFHLFALDGVQALLRLIGAGGLAGPISVRRQRSRLRPGRWLVARSLCAGNIIERRRDVLPPLLAPEIVLVIAGEDFNLAAA